MTADNHANDDLKAKMREALDRKNAKAKGVAEDAPLKEKAHGSEVQGGDRPEDAPPQGRRRGVLTAVQGEGREQVQVEPPPGPQQRAQRDR